MQQASCQFPSPFDISLAGGGFGFVQQQQPLRDLLTDVSLDALFNADFPLLDRIDAPATGTSHPLPAPAAPEASHLWASGSGSEGNVPAVDVLKTSDALQPSSSGDQQPKQGGSSRRSRSAEQKAQAVQEKNRRAQKRFRDRQKEKMRTMEDQVEALTKQLDQLRACSHKMTTRNGVLEKVLHLREEQLQVYQKDLQLFGEPADAPMKILGPQRNLAPALVPGEQPAPVSKTAEEVLAQWKGYVKEMATLLVELELASGSARDEVSERILRVVCSAGQLCMLTALFTPLNIKKLCASVGEERQLAMMGDPVAFWQPVQSSLELTAQQVEEVCKMLAMFTHRQAQLLEERRQVTASMQEATRADFDNGELRGPMRDLVKVHELSAALTNNLRDEHNTAVEFVGGLYKKVLTPMQLARCMVHSYPVYPDALALATCIAAEHRKQPASGTKMLLG